ncbi:M20 peptidase aminoacylase family protein [Calidifontibacillus erzurumensis]|uniref:M20 peptidase aminoacylase family protein n=1 Tax=Calidifontibacillus erzurumensis TaxID=2741433 RepID=A0A8J8KDJ5_9BACI|nr:M20 peptidase aminoacylase family protein [Calidifontibacillus erzurumensis]NSL53078.1 M20 peptidase aminoacylase family protein [Calidifontibacillus erzurumensis]
MKAAIEELKPTINQIFNHLHQNPEVGWKEVKTTEYIKQLLIEHGYNPQTFDDCTGLFVEEGDGDLCVGLRTDIDALWQEVDGTYKAIHSCGHDAHMTMVIGTMLLLKKLNLKVKGKLKFIFQPAEEKGTGALAMIEKGIIDDIDFLFGVHLRPIQELRDGQASPSIHHGAAKFISGKILGEDSHGARPHLGKNAIEIGATLINEISKIHLDPTVSYSAKMTKFHAGCESSNIIPGRAEFSLDLRAETNEMMEHLTNKIEKIVNAISNLYEVDIPLITEAQTAAAIVNHEAQNMMELAIIETIGKENLAEPIKSTGGEDFHFYTFKRPHLKATMLGLGCNLTPGLHHPNMTFNQQALLQGIEILTRAIMNTFKYKQN